MDNEIYVLQKQLFIKGENNLSQLRQSLGVLISIRSYLVFPTALCILRIQIAVLTKKAGAHAMVLCAMKHTAIKSSL